MQLKNSKLTYGLIAILFHWVMTILMIGLIILGLYMVKLPAGLEKLTFYGWHKEFGFLVLMLATLRLIWRLSNQLPELSTPLWEKLAARGVHWLFYGFMFALPLTGWLLTSAAGFSFTFFDIAIIPTIIEPNHQLKHFIKEIHEWLAYGLIGAIVLHMIASFKHHFKDKDNVLRRIFP